MVTGRECFLDAGYQIIVNEPDCHTFIPVFINCY